MEPMVKDAYGEEDEARTGNVILTVVLPTAATVLLVAALGVWLLVRGGESRSIVHSATDLRTRVPAPAVANVAGGNGTAALAPALPQPRPAARPPYMVYLVERAEQQAALGVPAGSSDALVVVVSSQETLAATLALVQVLAMGASEEPVAREVRVVDLRH